MSRRASVLGRGCPGGVKVIANSGVEASTISADDLKRIFLMTKTSLGGTAPVEPVLEKGGAVHESFVNEFLGKTSDALNAYYRSLVFTGKGTMPKVLGSDAEVAAYVARARGAIGYVSAGTNTPGVKSLEVR